MSARSRQGCDECRRRRRKCDEQKPCCGPCSVFNRTCRYSLRLVLGGFNSCKTRGRPPRANRPEVSGSTAGNVGTLVEQNRVPTSTLAGLSTSLPQSLPNGIPLSPRYQRLLSHFTESILASLSCHPSVHEDFRRGLIPVTLESPQLMSACLALSAAGFLSRGVPSLDGVEISKILGHLQSSGLSLLRSALQTDQTNETLLATCLIWCLTDVFTYRQGTSSWRIHLQGFRALLDRERPQQGLAVVSTSLQSAMKHLYQLYLSLRTLPYIPASEISEPAASVHLPASNTPGLVSQPAPSPTIDGFLGYSDELLEVIQQIDQLSRSPTSTNFTPPTPVPQADILLAKVRAMIARDSQAPPAISIHSPLSPEYGREFTLCHQIFQQATLLHLYRRLYSLPSNSTPIRAAVGAMEDMLSNLRQSQGQPCHTWVAMAMPLFNLGCEAYTAEQRRFVLDKVDKLEECIRSLHVRIIRQALRDLWDVRTRMGDDERGGLCAGRLLEKLDYNVVLF